MSAIRFQKKLHYASRVKNRGFTMVELLVVLAIGIILVAIAIPSYKTTIDTQKATLRANALLADIDYARSEAVKEGQNVTICPPASGATVACSTTATNWNGGWIVATTNSAGTMISLRTQAAFAESMTVSPAIPSTTVPALIFNRDGFALNITSGTGLLFTVSTADLNNGATRCIFLDVLGRPQLQTTSSAKVSGQQGTACTTPT